MIKRESYLSQIRPFIGKSELIKVIVGVRRSGKSIMLELIKEELLEKNVSQEQTISINFEDMKEIFETVDVLNIYATVDSQIHIDLRVVDIYKGLPRYPGRLKIR